MGCILLIYTGQAGWGIALYINGTLIPELVVERGRTYTFLISGGDNPLDGANYHPFYITDSVNGGRLLNTQEQRMVHQISTKILINVIVSRAIASTFKVSSDCSMYHACRLHVGSDCMADG
jgi:hypothetical protein